MSFWSLFKPAEANSQDSDTIRRIVGELESLPPERARYVAALAYVLGRVANADHDISSDETRLMELIVAKVGGLPEAQAVLVVRLAKAQNTLAGGTENFIVTRELAEMTRPEERQEILHCLFAVAAADNSISGVEEKQLQQIASELGITQRDYIEIRRGYNDLREVVRQLRQVAEKTS